MISLYSHNILIIFPLYSSHILFHHHQITFLCLNSQFYRFFIHDVFLRSDSCYDKREWEIQPLCCYCINTQVSKTSWQKIHGHQDTKTSGTQIKILFRKVKLLGLCFIICQLCKFKFHVYFICNVRDLRQIYRCNHPVWIIFLNQEMHEF